MKLILVVESEFAEEDTFATEVGRELAGSAALKGAAAVVICEGGDGALEAVRAAGERDEVFLLDAVSGIKEVSVLDDIMSLAERGGGNSHDFDLSYLLQEMKEQGITRKVKVIALPGEGDAAAVAAQVCRLVSQ